MGYLVDNVCHTDEAAYVAYAASVPPVLTTTPAGDLVSWTLQYVQAHCNPFDGSCTASSLSYVKQVNGLAESSFGVDPILVPCDPIQSVQDGAVLGWGVSLCFLAAFAFVLFRRAAA